MVPREYPGWVRKRFVRYFGIGIALVLLSFIAIFHGQFGLLIGWPTVVRWNAERLGANQAAAEAAKGKFSFILGSDPTSSMSHIYPGTPNCLMPGPDVTVTDWAFSSEEEGDRAQWQDAFASAHNRYLIEQFPKQASALCKQQDK